MIAALYIDSKRGPYAALPSVDAWGIERDATAYAGPWPVVAHPPCGHWGRYAHKCHDDGHTGPIAVAQVRRWGGVLEQPRDSKLWQECGLPPPGFLPEHAIVNGVVHFGRTIEVFQRDFGHAADKATWLYVVAPLVDPATLLPAMPPAMPPRNAWTPSKRDLGWTGTDRKRGTRGILECLSKNQRHLTPEPFALWLVALAERCR